MRHRRFTKRIGTDSEHARANLRNLAIALVKYGKIKTTVFKAKQLRPYIEKLITFGKKGDLHSRRIVVSRLNSKEAAKKIFDEIAKKYENRQGGYTRIVRAGYRNGDCAPMAYISFVEEELLPKTVQEENDKKVVDEIKEKVEEEIATTVNENSSSVESTDNAESDETQNDETEQEK